MAEYKIRIVVEGEDRASGSLNKVSGSLGRIAEFATGGLLVSGIENAAGAIASLGGEALSSYAKFERLGSSLETLVAKEMVSTGQSESMAEALTTSGDRAQELMGWIQKLAVESPFGQDDIASAFRLSLAYDFTTENAQRLTSAMLDFTAGSGASSDTMGRIALALGQIKARGTVAAEELNQLTESGISVRRILADAFGVSTAELTTMVSKGLVPANEAIEAIISSMETDFGGAAARQANSFAGLLSSLSELKESSLREFFSGTFQEVQPILAEFVGILTDPKNVESIRAMGDALGTWVGGQLDGLVAKADTFLSTFNQVSGFADSTSAAIAGIGSVTGAEVIIDAAAQIVSVDWASGGFTYIYDAGAMVLQTSIFWGAWSHTYDAKAMVGEDSVLWGAWTHVYDIKAEVDEYSVLWGAYTHNYDASAEITENSIIWGMVTHKYDAQAEIKETSIFWGLWTKTYDVKANITTWTDNFPPSWREWEVTATITKIFTSPENSDLSWLDKLTITIAVPALEFLKNLRIKPPLETDVGPLLTVRLPTFELPDWKPYEALPAWPTWPTLPVWTWPSYDVFRWPDYTAWTWPDYLTFTWPTFPTWTWPSIPRPTWNWPAIPTPGWLQTLIDIFNKGVKVNTPTDTGSGSGGGSGGFGGSGTGSGSGGSGYDDPNVESEGSIGASSLGAAAAAAVASTATQVYITIDAIVRSNDDIDRIAVTTAETLNRRLVRI